MHALVVCTIVQFTLVAMEFAETAATAADDSSFRPKCRMGGVSVWKTRMLYVYLAIGGVLGTLARFGIGGWIHTWAGDAFPWGTFGVNLLGSFILGLVMRGAELFPLSPELRGTFTIGFCGAFTTFSAFTFEALSMMQAGAWVRALFYAFGSLGIGLLAIFLGFSTANLLLRMGG